MVNYRYKRRAIKTMIIKRLSIGLCGFILLASISGCQTAPKEQRIFFYHRDELGGTYFDDYLVITNYESHPRTAAELYAIAKHYLDTVNARLEVNNISFMAKDVTGPRLHWDSDILNEERQYFLIDFDFNHFKPENLEKPKALNDITIWKNKKPTVYYHTKIEMQMPTNIRYIDSILNSPVPLSNR